MFYYKFDGGYVSRSKPFKDDSTYTLISHEEYVEGLKELQREWAAYEAQLAAEEVE